MPVSLVYQGKVKTVTLRHLVEQIENGKMPKSYYGIFAGETFTNLRFERTAKKRNLSYVEFEHNGRYQKYDSSQEVELIRGDLAFVSHE